MITMKKIIIAIDGYSSTGKSTVAKQLAQELHYTYVDTGAMYRAVTYFAMQNNFISGTHFYKKELIRSLKDVILEFRQIPEKNKTHIFLNGKDVEDSIRSLEVSNFVSAVAAVPEVRTKLVLQQQEMGKSGGIVMDGRDIGTVVFPQADLKVFMTAPAEVRAERRYKELLAKGEKVRFEDVLKNIQSRDLIDTTRSDSPLQKVADAIEFDNSNMSLDEQFKHLLKLAEEAIQQETNRTE